VSSRQKEIILAPEERRGAFIDVIRSARRRLLVSLFRCTDFAVMDAMAEALSRNVEVRLLLTPRARGWVKRLKELGAFLESMGAQVRSHADPVVKYHAKYMVADDGPALIGSANLTAKCFAASCDFILVTHDPAIVSGLGALFETDWLAPHSDFPAGITERLIVGPDRARAQFTALIERARRSIRIIDHKLNDPSILGLLDQKRAAGIRVEMLDSGRLGGLLPHGKLMIVDGRVAALGSMALSALSLDFRREVAVVVDDPRSVRKLKDFYRLLASGAQVIDPEYAERFRRVEENKKPRLGK
jgi:phosphatidylserine/phosphatidylglycerophosphate/cardiolipin synthase-like enzyme